VKKLISIVMSIALLLTTMPTTVIAATGITEIIKEHGLKTYMGTDSDWSKSSWDSDNFTDVTGRNVNCSEDLIIKSGTLGNVTVSDHSNLTISGGTVSDVDCGRDISITGGTVEGNVEADGTITLSEKSAVKGNVTGQNIEVIATGGSCPTVSGGISFTGSMTMEGTNYKLGTINGRSSGTLLFKNFMGTLPIISDIADISVLSGSTVTANSDVDAYTLTLANGAEFITASTLTVNCITGPGILKFTAGNLKINIGVSGSPIFDFNGQVANGATVFNAKSGTVSTGDIITNGYNLTKDVSANNSDYDTFSANDDISLDTTSVDIPIGCTYSVLAFTNATAPPTQVSYNSAIAIVGQAAKYNSNGKAGWVYPVTAVAEGGVTINIGGQKLFVQCQ